MTDPLRVALGSLEVGQLELTSAGERVFRFSASYNESPERRVLGQWFEDQDRSAAFLGREALPPYFANVLPQGALRRYLAEKLALREGQDFHLLAALGGDLPGALRVEPTADMKVENTRKEVSRRPKTRPRRSEDHYFSLAGMQLKFSMVEEASGLTLPSKTEEGRYIVKLPDSKREGVPETEYSMLEWARAAEINTVVARLEPRDRVHLAYHELPTFAEGCALAVRRFDRSSAGRLHQEDFAQVLNVEPDDKYARNTGAQRRLAHRAETLMTVLAAVSPGSVREAIRRLVFMVVSGNEDGHLKNWSLLYDEDGVRARLAPAYDLVCTVAFTNNRKPRLAMSIGGVQELARVTEASFHGVAEVLGWQATELDRAVREDLQRILDTRPSDWPLPRDVEKALDAHIGALDLRKGSRRSSRRVVREQGPAQQRRPVTGRRRSPTGK